jgi:hypothetical protein
VVVLLLLLLLMPANQQQPADRLLNRLPTPAGGGRAEGSSLPFRPFSSATAAAAYQDRKPKNKKWKRPAAAAETAII